MPSSKNLPLDVWRHVIDYSCQSARLALSSTCRALNVAARTRLLRPDDDVFSILQEAPFDLTRLGTRHFIESLKTRATSYNRHVHIDRLPAICRRAQNRLHPLYHIDHFTVEGSKYEYLYMDEPEVYWARSWPRAYQEAMVRAVMLTMSVGLCKLQVFSNESAATQLKALAQAGRAVQVLVAAAAVGSQQVREIMSHVGLADRPDPFEPHATSQKFLSLKTAAGIFLASGFLDLVQPATFSALSYYVGILQSFMLLVHVIVPLQEARVTEDQRGNRPFLSPLTVERIRSDELLATFRLPIDSWNESRHPRADERITWVRRRIEELPMASAHLFESSFRSASFLSRGQGASTQQAGPLGVFQEIALAYIAFHPKLECESLDLDSMHSAGRVGIKQQSSYSTYEASTKRPWPVARTSPAEGEGKSFLRRNKHVDGKDSSSVLWR